MLQGSPPVRLVKSPSCEDNMISGLLSSQHKCLLVVILLNQSPVVLGDDGLLHGMLVLRHHGDLNEHGCDVVDGLKHLETYCHVMWYHSSSLLDLLLLSLFQVLAKALT